MWKKIASRLSINTTMPANDGMGPSAGGGIKNFAAHFFANLKTGLRALFFMPVNSAGLHAEPSLFSLLAVLLLLVSGVIGYLEYGFGSTFYSHNFVYLLGGIGILIASALPSIWGRKDGQDYMRLPTLVVAMVIFYTMIFQPIPWIVWKRGWVGDGGSTTYYVLRDLGDVWLAATFVLAARRVSRPNAGFQTFLTVIYAIALTTFLSAYPMTSLWTNYKPDEKETAKEDKNTSLLYSEDLFALEPVLFRKEISALKPERPGYPDIYFLGVAPYSFQDVFMKEVKTVADVFAKNFGTAGRSMLLINNIKTLDTVPMATQGHLRDALKEIGKRMNTEEDVLVLYFTSHGSKEAGLAINLGGYRFHDLAPEGLKAMLDSSGIKWRILIISGCHTGVYIPSLKNDRTLVITAADADHMSYGCSNDGDMTDFARTLVTKHLSKTHDFIAAFEDAQKDVHEDEKDQHLVHSNPQMAVGDDMRKKLAELKSRLDEGKPH